MQDEFISPAFFCFQEVFYCYVNGATCVCTVLSIYGLFIFDIGFPQYTEIAV